MYACTCTHPLPVMHVDIRHCWHCTDRQGAASSGAAGAKADADDTETAELAQFIINGVCPRCSKVVERAHRKHLAACRQRPPELATTRQGRGEPTIAAAIEVERAKLANMEHKLTELDVGTLCRAWTLAGFVCAPVNAPLGETLGTCQSRMQSAAPC